MSSKSIALFEKFRAAQGRPVAKPVDISGHAAMVKATNERRASQCQERLSDTAAHHQCMYGKPVKPANQWINGAK